MRKLHSQIVFAGFPGLCFPCKCLWCASRPGRDARKKCQPNQGTALNKEKEALHCLMKTEATSRYSVCFSKCQYNKTLQYCPQKTIDWVRNRKYVVASSIPTVCEVLASTLGSQSNKPGTNNHPIEVHLPSSPETRPVFLHQSTGHPTT